MKSKTLFKLLRPNDALDISGFWHSKFEIVEKSHSVAILTLLWFKDETENWALSCADSFEIRFRAENTLKWGYIYTEFQVASGVNKFQVFREIQWQTKI